MPPTIITYDKLTPGFEFPPASYTLEPKTVAAYLRAIGGTGEAENSRTAPGSVVPPAAVAALSMRGLIAQLPMSPGMVQLTQDFEFLKPATVGETIICRASISKKQERAGLKMVTFELAVINGAGDTVMTGRTLVGIVEKKT